MNVFWLQKGRVGWLWGRVGDVKKYYTDYIHIKETMEDDADHLLNLHLPITVNQETHTIHTKGVIMHFICHESPLRWTQLHRHLSKISKKDNPVALLKAQWNSTSCRKSASISDHFKNPPPMPRYSADEQRSNDSEIGLTRLSSGWYFSTAVCIYANETFGCLCCDSGEDAESTWLDRQEVHVLLLQLGGQLPIRYYPQNCLGGQ